MCTAVETYHICSEDISSVVFFWWHNAVCSEQECARNVNEFFLLVLPCSTEVTFQFEDVFSIQGKRGKVTFHHEYRCLRLYHLFVPTIGSSREGHDQLQR